MGASVLFPFGTSVTSGSQTFAGNKVFSGASGAGPALAVTKTAQASAAEIFATFGTDDDSDVLTISNVSATNAVCIPMCDWGANVAGRAAPAFTTRSVGTRLVIYSGLSGSAVDYAIGTASNVLWFSIPTATSTPSFKWYGGTTEIASLKGDGLLTTTGGRVNKVRVATTTPVTGAVTDYIIVTKLAAPGAVAVSLPAGVTGACMVIKDGTGDAAANNITITPAAGTIDGAATKVISTNYGTVTLVYSETEWLSY